MGQCVLECKPRTISMQDLTLTAITAAENALFYIDLCQSHWSMKGSQGQFP